MKTIITTVGTSLFENYMSSDIKILFRTEGEHHTDISQAVADLKNKDASTYDSTCTEIEDTINPTIKSLWLKGVSKNRQGWLLADNVHEPNQYASAEIESIVRIQEELSQEVKVYLVCTDTILSVLAAELIKTFFNCKDFGGNEYTDIEVVFERTHKHIAEDLRVSDNDDYQKGFMNLIEIVNEVINRGDKTNCYLNITGGYKAIIPVMTLMGQIKGVPLNYLYEDSDNSEKPVVKIGKMPVSFDWTKVEAFLQLLDNESLKNETSLKEVVDEFVIEQLEEYALIQKSTKKKSDYELSIVGEILKQTATSDNSPLGQDILGLYMEDKIRNFFNTNEYEKVQYKATSIDLFETPEGKVVTVRNSNNDTEIGDVDIVLKDRRKVILGEVKSYGQTQQNNLEKIIRRLEAYHKLNECYPSEFWWFVQSVDIPISDRIKESNPHYNPVKWYEKREHNKVRILRHFKEELGKKYSKINFKAFVIELPLVKGDLKVNYSKLLKKQLKENDIISINL